MQWPLHNSPSLSAFLDLLETGHSLLLEKLWETPKALLAVMAVKKTGRSLLLLTGGTREDALFDNLLELAPDLPLEFPSWETFPGETIPCSPDLIGKRMETLHTLLKRKSPSIVVCPIASFFQTLPPPAFLSPHLQVWKRGDTRPFNQLSEQLDFFGYKRAAVVSEKGEFAIRGGILDLFPASASAPYRIDFFGDEIDRIRTFDPIGQKTKEIVEMLFLSPVSEWKLLQTAPSLVSIGEYLGENPLLFFDDLVQIEEGVVAFQSLAKSANCDPSFLFSFEQQLERYKKQTKVFFSTHLIEELSEVKLKKKEKPYTQESTFELLHRPLTADRFFHPFQTLDDFLEPTADSLLEGWNPPERAEIVFLTSDETERKAIEQKLPSTANVRFEKGSLSAGLAVSDIKWALIPYAEIAHKKKIRRQKWRSVSHSTPAEFHQLTPGDLVVHFHSGIGRYLGMEKHVNHLGAPTEFLILQYAEESKLFVPLSQAYLVSRYVGAEKEAPSLSQLGSKRWQNTRQQAQTQILGYANDLLHLYAERVAHGGFCYPPDSLLMQQFEASFPYQETEDQLLSIAAIKEDMISGKAMDRLVCGDVGYGKTEVAMRAAFKAVADGQKQVAILVPTTVLAMQHFETFSSRMSGFPIVIEVASRFRTPKQNRNTLERAKKGEVDILIGTHRLLSEDVSFKELGLIVIDEEQRFGVRAKEHLKKMKRGVDCLTLSATPIPRTLYMSLTSARDLSVINTPPQDRLPVRTLIAETDLDLVTSALLREFARGGQSFFIHNRVETIYGRAEAIQKLVPALKIGIVHGQMDPDEIDPIFHAFKQGEIHLLFATTIVENGIDIPNANTIIVDRADTYGLADLYQLRGRVGRWNRPAYAYFLIPKGGYLQEITRKRLNALAESGSHGGGMKIAMRDLEIRGAGDLLGVQQSGQISSIGFHLYCKLLKRAIDALKKKKAIRFEETKLESSFDARIPEEYIPEISIRMELYYRLGEASDFEEVDELLAEMKDRFGPPPLPVLWLYHLARLRAFGTAHYFTLIKFHPLTFATERLRGKEVEKKSWLLPKKVQSDPKELEAYVIQELQKTI
jgi:transcription-repair coupling factor (superfamily II helicase)